MWILKASLVLALAQAIVAALPRLPAAVKHLILVTGMAAFLVVPVLEVAGPTMQVLNVGQAAARPGQAAARPAFNRDTLTHGDTPAMVWLAGVGLLFTRFLRRRLRLRSILRQAVPPSPRLQESFGRPPRVRLLRSARVHVPMIWGLWNGTLLLPEAAEQWSDEELRATFIHELGHLRRRDPLTLGLMNVLSAWIWFHPQLWIARRRALAEGERACDDLVLRAGGRPSDYAMHLLNVARCAPDREPLAQLLAMSRPGELEGRMLAILSPSTNRQSIGGKRLMLTLATFLAVVVPLSAVQLTAQPAAPVPVISAEELSARPYHVVEKLEGRVCTLKLRRPTPAEGVALQRLQQKAGEYAVDGVANVKCHREVGIGLRCPTSVVCTGDAIVFE
jgi:beta-lactamase regulating signal transducer with metallopeptidase domain